MQDSDQRMAATNANTLLRQWSAQARPPMMAGLGGQLLGLLGWILIAIGVGRAVGQAGQDQAQNWLLLAFAGLLIRGGAFWFSDHGFVKAGLAMVEAARTHLFGKIETAGAAWLGGENSGSRVSQLIDRTAKLSGYAARWLPGIRFAVIGPVVILIIVLTQSWLSAVLLFVSVLVLPVFIYLTARETAQRARAQQASLDALSGRFQTSAARSGLIRAFRAVTREANTLELASLQLRDRTMAILRVAFLSTAILEFFASVSIALVAVYIGFKLLGVFPFETGETLTLSEGLTVLILAPEFFAPIRRLSTLHHDRSDAKAAAEFLADWLNTAPERTVDRLAPTSKAPVLHYDQVQLGWQEDCPVFHPVSFTAQPGTVTVLAGPSGSGKSTALLTLLGQARVLSGAIRVDDRTLNEGESLADSTAYIGQTPWLMEASLEENIRLGREGASEADIDAAARAAGIFDFADESRHGLKQKLSRFGSGLSGGQRQRIALARAILRNAPIILMDEPTAHLDPEAEQAFLDRLSALKAGRTILIATHEKALIGFADQIVTLQSATTEALS